jgi:hypothetical protein
MKKIAYLITDSGCDGREKTTIRHAFWDEAERDTAFKNDKNKAYYSKSEIIVDVERDTKIASAKINGLDKLLLASNLVGLFKPEVQEHG